MVSYVHLGDAEYKELVETLKKALVNKVYCSSADCRAELVPLVRILAIHNFIFLKVFIKLLYYVDMII